MEKVGEAYNVCNTEQFVSILELANRLVKLHFEWNLKVVQGVRKKEEKYTENTVANFVPPSNNKLKKLGWEAIYSIEDGFNRVIEHFIENK